MPKRACPDPDAPPRLNKPHHYILSRIVPYILGPTYVYTRTRHPPSRFEAARAYSIDLDKELLVTPPRNHFKMRKEKLPVKEQSTVKEKCNSAPRAVVRTRELGRHELGERSGGGGGGASQT
ncbi:hypothetical protein HGRIS_011752 [Hohenbuehelia grisea]|uniref:Uncharacterized protein n=1 Tax=Hohenbuehelia grisea TaxID=104357 RepID=A0ABR3JW29_9AGAR